MKRTTALGVFVLALAVVFVTAPATGAFAQDPKGGGGGGGQGAPGGGGGGGVRGGGATSGSGPVSSGGSGGGSWSGGTSGGGMSGGGMSGGGMVGGSPGMMAMPRGAGRTEGAGRQPNGSPRWSGGDPSTAREGRPFGGAFGRSAVDDEMAGRPRAGAGSSGADSSVPWYARSRGGNPATGTAVTRPDAPVGGGGGGGYYPPGYPGWYPGYGGGYWGYYDCAYYPYYGCGNPWGYGGFGLGYFYFNPFMWNYGDYMWGGGGGGGGSYGGQQMGSIRLRVKPSTASVYVDGYYAGTVDDFDNSFQKLSLALGAHKIEISAPGYQPLIIEIDVRDFDTINYQGELVPIR
jgi:hypothetical protein